MLKSVAVFSIPVFLAIIQVNAEYIIYPNEDAKVVKKLFLIPLQNQTNHYFSLIVF